MVDRERDGHPTLTKEKFSLAFVRSIILTAGCMVQEPDIDNDKVYFTLRPQKRGPNKNGVRAPLVDVQLKSTTKLKFDGTDFLYDLDVDTYNDLADVARMAPCYLFVLTLPKKQSDWVNASAEQLGLRHQVLWYPMTGVESSSNSETQRVRIPKANRLTPDAVNQIVEEVSR